MALFASRYPIWTGVLDTSVPSVVQRIPSHRTSQHSSCRGGRPSQDGRYRNPQGQKVPCRYCGNWSRPPHGKRGSRRVSETHRLQHRRVPARTVVQFIPTPCGPQPARLQGPFGLACPASYPLAESRETAGRGMMELFERNGRRSISLSGDIRSGIQPHQLPPSCLHDSVPSCLRGIA